VSKAERVYVAGDDDQAIYRWAGARPEFLMNMEGTRTILNRSYRLAESIHAKANKLIKRVSDRVDKEWTAREEKGQVNIHPVE
jgi:superfamily I DNA/RNA helicase